MKSLIENNKELLTIISDTAMKNIADKHNTNVEMVKIAISSGQKVVTEQYTKLVKAGFIEALKLDAVA